MRGQGGQGPAVARGTAQRSAALPVRCSWGWLRVTVAGQAARSQPHTLPSRRLPGRQQRREQLLPVPQGDRGGRQRSLVPLLCAPCSGPTRHRPSGPGRARAYVCMCLKYLVRTWVTQKHAGVAAELALPLAPLAAAARQRERAVLRAATRQMGCAQRSEQRRTAPRQRARQPVHVAAALRPQVHNGCTANLAKQSSWAAGSCRTAATPALGRPSPPLPTTHAHTSLAAPSASAYLCGAFQGSKGGS